jgi:branched-chain amino acid transport system permease protein
MTRALWFRGGILMLAVAAMAVLPLQLKSYGIYIITLWCVFVIAGMGLNLTVGYAGQISLGQAAFLGIGAYTAALLMKQAGLAFLPSIAAAALAAGTPQRRAARSGPNQCQGSE